MKYNVPFFPIFNISLLSSSFITIIILSLAGKITLKGFTS